MTSYAELTQPFGAERKQHFLDTFDGDALRSWWNVVLEGSATTAMNDEANGGYRATITTNTADLVRMNFNSIRPFAPNAHKYIFEMRMSTNTNIFNGIGLTNGITSGGAFSSSSSFTSIGYSSGVSSNYYLGNNNTTTPSTNTVTGVTADTNWHNFMLESNLTAVKAWVDGDFTAINTSDIPTGGENMTPLWEVGNSSTNAFTVDVRYFEVWNT